MGDKDDVKQSKVQADDQSIAIGSVDIGGDVSGNIKIGHTIGYTSKQVSALIAHISSTFQPKPFNGRCPYKGLDFFEEVDAELFFGREKLVEELVERVKDSRTVFITGPSGSGKSSLVRAGLLHALKQGDIKDSHSEGWLYATLKPGRDPFEALALAFSRLKLPDLAKYFRENLSNPDIIQQCAESALSDNPNQRLVLFIDQFEEVFTQLSAEKAETFIQLITNAAGPENGRVIFLFAMRSDFVSNCATYPELNALLNQQFVQIGTMQPDELVSAIAQPALRVGLRIDPDLIAQIINDMQGEPGALPLMQFALKDLFEAEQAKDGMIALTREAYLQRGGIQKSLERHADASFGKLEKHEQELARSIFGGLIEIGRGTQDTRRTAIFDELIPADAKEDEVQSIVKKLADARLITTDEISGKDTVTISHEKLIESWPWLKKLVNENRDVIALQNEIAADAKEWEEHKRDKSYLYAGARLANAREQLKAKKLNLSGTAYQFIHAGRSRQQRGQRTAIAGIMTIMALLVLAVIVFSRQSAINKETASTAQAANTLAVEQASTAKAANTLAVAQQLTAEVSAEEAQKQARIALARQIAAKAQSLYAERSSHQMIATLLAIRSMQLYPNKDAQQFLMNNTGAQSIARMNHEGIVTSVAFSPDGKYVASGGCEGSNFPYSCPKGSARVWEVATGEDVTRMIQDDLVISVAFSQDGNYVISNIFSSPHVWETFTGKEISPSSDEFFRVTTSEYPSVNPDSTYLAVRATTSEDYSVRPDGKYKYELVPATTGRFYFENGIRILDTDTGDEIARMEHDSTPECEICIGTYRININSVSFSPTGEYIATGSDDRTARLWEITTGKEVALMTHDGTTNDQTTPDGAVTSVAFSPDGKYIVSGSKSGTVHIWELPKSNEVSLDSTGYTHDALLNKDNQFSQDGKYKLWVDIGGILVEDDAGKEIAFLPTGGADNYNRFDTSPDGKYIVTGGVDGIVRVWDTITFEEVTQMNHGGWVVSVDFSPNDKYVVSGASLGTIRVWDISTEEEIASIDGGLSGVLSNTVAFSPDGKYIVSQDLGKAWFWQAGDLIEIECMNVSRNLTRSEWKEYLGNTPYQAICSNLPIEPEAAPTPSQTQ